MSLTKSFVPTHSILIVEDEPIIAADLQFEIEKLGYEHVEKVASGEEAIQIVKTKNFDLILMDVQLAGEIDGIDASLEIQKKSDIPIIFLTSNTDQKTFIRAKLTKPQAFLSKPFRAIDLRHAVALAFDESDSETEDKEVDEVWFEDRFFIRSKDWFIKITVDDLLWIEADGCYCKLHTKQQDHTIISTLKRFEEEAPNKLFKRIHRSYMVNLHAIDKISDQYVSIGSKTIPVGKKYKKELFDIFKRI